MRFLWLIVVLYTVCNHVLADQIFPGHVGATFRSSREPKYQIEFHSEDSPFLPDDDQESIVIPNKNGENYLCFLPKVEKAKSEKPITQLNISSMIVETEERVKLKTPDELLEVLIGSALSEIIVETMHLKGKIPTHAKSVRYHAHQYTNGTICDLTNEPRETEVRFVCSEPRAMISSVIELSTCKYALTVQSPMLCKHSLFQEERPVWHTINCNLLPKDYKEAKPDEVETEDEQIFMVSDVESSNYDSDE
ncbi:hypothetical protein H0E87_029287 [Populus deltoides]|uniref:MRH domain-containing protein n=1 Tax=Populus deltoides TaxID=3696 RepID=A0A8T2WPW0_POPDE|nr:hypothetical protein H0E87_029287 [Populus deltoides]